MVTSVCIDPDFVVCGLSNGLVKVYHAGDGSYVTDLNVLDVGPSEQDSQDPSEQITGVRFHGKVNVLCRLGKWLFAGFQNGRVCLYHLGTSRTLHPLSEYCPEHPHPILHLHPENGYVFLLVKPQQRKKKKKDKEEGHDPRPDLIVWQPTFKRKVPCL